MEYWNYGFMDLIHNFFMYLWNFGNMSLYLLGIMEFYQIGFLPFNYFYCICVVFIFLCFGFVHYNFIIYGKKSNYSYS